MVKIYLTGDNHIGRSYSRHSAREFLSQARIDALKDMVDAANSENCSLFVVSGDLFDRTQMPKSVVASVAKILSGFSGDVLVLPGNHDYFEDDSRLWNDFSDAAGSGVVVLGKSCQYSFESPDGEKIAVYPAPCRSKKSEENNLSWIKSLNIVRDDVYRIGIAHGAIEGLSLDSEGRYYKMSIEELEKIPVDVWLIGHMHVPYPDNLSETSYSEGSMIFNAGSHVQTDVHNNTCGWGFIIEIDKGGHTSVRAKKHRSGKLSFYRKTVAADPSVGLSASLSASVKDMPDCSSVELSLKGTVSKDDYENRSGIYEQALSRFIEYTVNDSELSELISEKMILDKYAAASLPAKMLLRLLDEPKEAQMLFELLLNVDSEG